MKPAMYLFVNKGLGMSTGKTAAQVAHAAVEAFQISKPALTEEWYKGRHYMKLVMECRDSEHLLMTERYLNDRGFNTALIIDEGHTEIDPITPTALGVEIVDKDDEHTAASFVSFKLYKDTAGKIPVGAYLHGPGDKFPKHMMVPTHWNFESGKDPKPAPKRRWWQPKPEGHYQNAGY